MAKQLNFKAHLITSIKSDDKPLPEQVAERITQMIVDDSYRAGHKLPNEFVLAERLGVGRSTVREAIKILASRNILEVRRGSGTFISENMGRVDDPLGFRFYRSKKRLAIDLCEIRMMLEPEVAAAAALNASARHLDELARLAARVAELFLADQDHSAVDVELHKKIAEASGNLVAPGIVGIVSTAIPLFVHVSKRSLKHETIDTHRKVVQAIANRDPEGARRAMREHLEYNINAFEALPDDF